MLFYYLECIWDGSKTNPPMCDIKVSSKQINSKEEYYNFISDFLPSEEIALGKDCTTFISSFLDGKGKEKLSELVANLPDRVLI